MKQFKTFIDSMKLVEGFQMRFDNEVVVSIGFGEMHMCDGGETTSEVAVFRGNDWFALENNQLIKTKISKPIPHCSVNDVVEILNLAKQIK